MIAVMRATSIVLPLRPSRSSRISLILSRASMRDAATRINIATLAMVVCVPDSRKGSSADRALTVHRTAALQLGDHVANDSLSVFCLALLLVGVC